MRTRKPVQKLPAPTETQRVESGPIKFGDDWPGLFLRGDDCFALLMDIQSVLKQIGKDSLATLRVGTGVELAELVEMIEYDVIVPRNKRKKYEDAADGKTSN